MRSVASSIVVFPRLLSKRFSFKIISFKIYTIQIYLSQKMAKDRPTNLPVVGNPQNTPHCDKQFVYTRY